MLLIGMLFLLTVFQWKNIGQHLLLFYNLLDVHRPLFPNNTCPSRKTFLYLSNVYKHIKGECGAAGDRIRTTPDSPPVCSGSVVCEW